MPFEAAAGAAPAAASTISGANPSVGALEATRFNLEDAEHNARIRHEEALALERGDRETAQRRARHDVGRRWLGQEGGDLAKEASPRQQPALVGVDDDRRLALDDEVERRVVLTSADDPLTLAERDRVEALSDSADLGRREVAKNAQPGEAVDEIGVHGRHGKALG